MPRALEPNRLISIVLSGDKDTDPTPTFYARALSVRAFTGIIDAFTAIKESKDAAQQLTLAMAQICKCIVDWDNMIDPDTGDPIPFSQDALSEVLDLMECLELMEALTKGAQLNADEEKKLTSPH